MRKVAYIVFSSVVAFTGVGRAVAQRTTPEYDDDSGPVMIFFVRHGEASGDTDPRVPLAARDLARADNLIGM